SRLLRSLSAACQSFCSKPTTAAEPLPFLAASFFLARPRFFASGASFFAAVLLFAIALFAPASRLLVDPPVQIGPLDAPLPADLEGRQLAGVGVDRLLRELEQHGDFLDGQHLVRNRG